MTFLEGVLNPLNGDLTDLFNGKVGRAAITTIAGRDSKNG
jgi:hypothetical protein